MNTLKYKIGLGLIPRVGSILAKQLIAYTGSAEAVFREKKEALIKIPKIGEQIAHAIVHQKVLQRAEKEIEYLQKEQIQTLFYLDEAYPNRLKACKDSPILLYYKGNANLNQTKIISIVGTRNMTDYGREACSQLIHDLSHHNPLIISGLAFGVDICSHRAALKNNLATVGVLAHGLAKIYPSQHRDIAQQMLGQGGLLTEYLSDTQIDRKYFLQRNRIVAGLSDATIVVESASKGGALATAAMASSYHRKVFVFAGRSIDKYSAGCNFLIKNNTATLIENSQDLEFQLDWAVSNCLTRPFNQYSANADEQMIINLLHSQGEQFIDSITYNTQLTPSKVSVLLLNLEFAGIVRSLAGKRYVLA